MILIAGPRQSGKTTFARLVGGSFANSLYFNWDNLDDKKKLLRDPYFYQELDRKDLSIPLVTFDELHKYRQWKNYLKGVFDRDGENYRFLITGSGRLDIYQKGGDSLAGRYFLFHLWPFTLAELAGSRRDREGFFNDPLAVDVPREALGRSSEIWNDMTLFSGFPDPYLRKDKEFYVLWNRSYAKQVLREDIRDITALRNTDAVELLFALLPSRIGSPLSMANIASDLSISPDTVKSWIGLLERFYMVFRIPPWSRKITRAITKESKAYLFDCAFVENHGARFENMVAIELMRAVWTWNDSGYGRFSLHYLRNREKEEVDFLIVRDREPFCMVETKLSDPTPSPGLKKFQSALGVPAVQLVNEPGIFRILSNENQKILVSSAPAWLMGLP
jgi:uncharacterized protein